MGWHDFEQAIADNGGGAFTAIEAAVEGSDAVIHVEPEHKAKRHRAETDAIAL